MKPVVEPLAHWRRKLIFAILVVAFLLSLPAFMFYATGYRYNFFSSTPSITATGGLYIAANALESTIFVDEKEITNARVFRNASYIQGLQPGLQRVHVQAPGLHTWVKKLSVYPHIVTEAESFNLPLVPQVRPLTKFQTVQGEGVFIVASTTAPLFPLASSSVSFIVTTSTATSTYRLNPEYTLIDNLFIAEASTTAMLLKKELAFSFATTSNKENDLATTTITRGNLSLYKNGEDIYVAALGSGKQIPHYFCTSHIESVGNFDLKEPLEVPAEELFFEGTINELSNNTRDCRINIKIDRQSQAVRDFEFFPANQSLVLMTLENGLYVVEIDDRSWQNTQLLYPGKNLTTLVHSGGIFIKDGSLLLEVLTELIPQ